MSLITARAPNLEALWDLDDDAIVHLEDRERPGFSYCGGRLHPETGVERDADCVVCCASEPPMLVIRLEAGKR